LHFFVTQRAAENAQRAAEIFIVSTGLFTGSKYSFGKLKNNLASSKVSKVEFSPIMKEILKTTLIC